MATTPFAVLNPFVDYLNGRPAIPGHINCLATNLYVWRASAGQQPANMAHYYGTMLAPYPNNLTATLSPRPPDATAMLVGRSPFIFLNLYNAVPNLFLIMSFSSGDQFSTIDIVYNENPSGFSLTFSDGGYHNYLVQLAKSTMLKTEPVRSFELIKP